MHDDTRTREGGWYPAHLNVDGQNVAISVRLSNAGPLNNSAPPAGVKVGDAQQDTASVARYALALAHGLITAGKRPRTLDVDARRHPGEGDELPTLELRVAAEGDGVSPDLLSEVAEQAVAASGPSGLSALAARTRIVVEGRRRGASAASLTSPAARSASPSPSSPAAQSASASPTSPAAAQSASALPTSPAAAASASTAAAAAADDPAPSLSGSASDSPASAAAAAHDSSAPATAPAPPAAAPSDAPSAEAAASASAPLDAPSAEAEAETAAAAATAKDAPPERQRRFSLTPRLALAARAALSARPSAAPSADSGAAHEPIVSPPSDAPSAAGAVASTPAAASISAVPSADAVPRLVANPRDPEAASRSAASPAAAPPPSTAAPPGGPAIPPEAESSGPPNPRRGVPRAWAIRSAGVVGLIAVVALAFAALQTMSPGDADRTLPAVTPTAEPNLRAAAPDAPTAVPALAAAPPTTAPTTPPTAIPALAQTLAPNAQPTTVPSAVPGPAGAAATPPPAAAFAVAPTAQPPAAPAPLLDFAASPAARVAWPNNPASTAWLAGDGYHLAARAEGQFVAIGLPDVEPQTNVRVTATFRKLSGPPGGGYGIVLRDQSPTPRDGLAQGSAFYVLEVGDRGEIGIWRRNDATWVDLVAWTATPAVRRDGENTLVATVQGEKLSLLVNGTSVAEAADSALARGRVGVFLGGDLNEALLSRLLVEPLQ